MGSKTIFLSARQAKWLLHLFAYLLDKFCSLQGYFLKCKTNWVMLIYSRRWFLVLTRGWKVQILKLQKRELLRLKFESFWGNSRVTKHFKAPWR